MPWYIPLTIIPGVALLILSTTNLIIALNAEITNLKKDPTDEIQVVVTLKLAQLIRLSISISLLYLGVLLLLLAGVARGLGESYHASGKGFLLTAVVIVSTAILILIVYSLKAVSIRSKHLNITPNS